MPSPRGRRPAPQAPQAPKSKTNPVPWVVGGAVLLVVAGFLLFKPGAAPPPPEPSKPVVQKSAAPPPPPPPPRVEPVDTGPDDPAARFKWLVRMQGGAPKQFKRWHAEWTALQARVKGGDLEPKVGEEIERLEA